MLLEALRVVCRGDNHGVHPSTLIFAQPNRRCGRHSMDSSHVSPARWTRQDDEPTGETKRSPVGTRRRILRQLDALRRVESRRRGGSGSIGRLWIDSRAATGLHDSGWARQLQLGGVTCDRVTNRALMARRRPQETHADVIDRRALDGLTTHDFDIIGVFHAPELQRQPGDRTHAEPPPAFDEAARCADIDDADVKLACQYPGLSPVSRVISSARPVQRAREPDCRAAVGSDIAGLRRE